MLLQLDRFGSNNSVLFTAPFFPIHDYGSSVSASKFERDKFDCVYRERDLKWITVLTLFEKRVPIVFTVDSIAENKAKMANRTVNCNAMIVNFRKGEGIITNYYIMVLIT